MCVTGNSTNAQLARAKLWRAMREAQAPQPIDQALSKRMTSSAPLRECPSLGIKNVHCRVTVPCKETSKRRRALTIQPIRTFCNIV
jgi:hypothetical protein